MDSRDKTWKCTRVCGVSRITIPSRSAMVSGQISSKQWWITRRNWSSSSINVCNKHWASSDEQRRCGNCRIRIRLCMNNHVEWWCWFDLSGREEDYRRLTSWWDFCRSVTDERVAEGSFRPEACRGAVYSDGFESHDGCSWSKKVQRGTEWSQWSLLSTDLSKGFWKMPLVECLQRKSND